MEHKHNSYKIFRLFFIFCSHWIVTQCLASFIMRLLRMPPKAYRHYCTLPPSTLYKHLSIHKYIHTYVHVCNTLQKSTTFQSWRSTFIVRCSLFRGGWLEQRSTSVIAWRQRKSLKILMVFWNFFILVFFFLFCFHFHWNLLHSLSN